MGSRAIASRRWTLLLGVLLLPLFTFFGLTGLAPGYDRTVAVPTEHFYIVSGAAVVALALAILIGIASLRTREPRTLAVALGFLFVAGIFSVHGLLTPGDGLLVHDMHDSIVISSRLSLFIGSIFFLLAAFSPPKRVVRVIAAHHGMLLTAAIAAVAFFVATNLVRPDVLDWLPTGEATRSQPSAGSSNTFESSGYGAGYSAGEVYGQRERSQVSDAPVYTPVEQLGRGLAYAMAALASAALLIAAWRFFDTFHVSRTPATLAMAAGMLLLAEGQIIMALGEVWHLSWWLYHGAMLAGFVIPVAGIGLAYRRGSNLTEIVDGLFIRDTLARIERSFPEAINDLINAIEDRDPYTRGHMRRVAELSLAIAEEMRIPAANARAAGHAALLHDIGKLGIPEAVLHKPGRLTEDEFELLKTHPARGHQIVNQAPALHAAAPAIRWHHERLDGSGYPDGLAGDEIPLEARIVAAADVWDALTSDRIYRAAMSESAARAIIQREAGAKLDADCVAALFAVIEREDRPSVRIPYRQPRTEQARPSYLAS